jgi:transposase
VRELSWGGRRGYLQFEVRRVQCQSCGTVKRERLEVLADHPFSTKRFVYYVGKRWRSAPRNEVAAELPLDWDTVKALEKQSMAAHLAKAGTPGPQVSGSDESAIRKGPPSRIVVSELRGRRVSWGGGTERAEASREPFSPWLGERTAAGIRWAVRDMGKPWRPATRTPAPPAAILFDKFHPLSHLGDALDAVRKAESRRLSGRDRRASKGQKYPLLSRRENLTRAGRQTLQVLLAANQRLHLAYVLKASFGQLWEYEREGWARRSVEPGRASLKGQRLPP